MSKPEIGAVLTLDDAASAVINKVKSGFNALGNKADEVASHMADIGKQFVGSMLGADFSSATSAVQTFGQKAIESALIMETNSKNAVAMAASVAKIGSSYEQIEAHSKQLNTELSNLSVSAGISTSAISDAFASVADKMNPVRAAITSTGQSILYPMTIVEKGLQRSDAQITALLKDIGNAGKLVAGGPEALARSFAGFSATGAKASDPIVQMIAATGVLKGNAAQVAQQLHMLTDGSAMSFAQAAIEKMARKGRDMAPDFQTTVSQLASLRDQFVSQFGAPILKTVVPVIDKFRNTLNQNKAKIEEFAKTMGDKVGKWVTTAGAKMHDGFKYIIDHQKQIGEAIEKGALVAERVFKFIFDNKETIAAVYGARAVAPAVGSVMSAARGGYGLAFGAGGANLAGLGASAASIGQSLAVLGAFAAAIGGLALAVNQATKLFNEMGGSISGLKPLFGMTDDNADQAARKEALAGISKSIGEQNMDQVFALRTRYALEAGKQGKDVAEASKYADAQIDAYLRFQSLIKEADKVKASLDASPIALRKGDEAGPASPQESNISKVAELYNAAMKSNNMAAAQYAANIIAGSSSVQNALVNSKTILEGGFDGLAGVLGDKGIDLAKKLKDLSEDAAGKTPTKPVVQFNNNTFNLKQDFRDQDPDKVALVFRRDIMREAEARRQSRTGGAFGL